MLPVTGEGKIRLEIEMRTRHGAVPAIQIMIRRYEIAGLAVEIRLAEGMERLIPAQFREFETEQNGHYGETETDESGRAMAQSLPDGRAGRRLGKPGMTDEGRTGRADEQGELLDDTANDMGRVRLFRLGSGNYLIRLTDMKGDNFEMIASEDFSVCSIRGDRGEYLEIRMGEKFSDMPDKVVYGHAPAGRDCGMPWTDNSDGQPAGGSVPRRGAVGSLIRIAFSQTVLLHRGVSIHASAVENDGQGYIFLGASGTGKSTHSQIWIDNIPDTELLNDDNPAVRLMPDGTARVFGTPWSGKTPCYRQTSALLHGIVRLEQSTVNEFRRVNDIDAFAMLLPSCSVIKTSPLLHNALCDTLIALSEAVTTGVMRCRPDAEAAIACMRGLRKRESMR